MPRNGVGDVAGASSGENSLSQRGIERIEVSRRFVQWIEGLEYNSFAREVFDGGVHGRDGVLVAGDTPVYTLKGKTCNASCQKTQPPVLLPDGVSSATAGTGVDASKLGDDVQVYGRTVTKAWVLFHMALDWGDHYSQAATMLRLNGITPPSAQRRTSGRQ